MTLTRDYKDTTARLQNDPAFARALLHEYSESFSGSGDFNIR